MAELGRVDRGALRAAEAEAAWLQGRQQECFALIELALADLEGTGTAAEVAALAGSTVIQTFVDVDGRPALARARRAVELADEVGAEQGYARTRLASVLVTAGEPGWVELYDDVIARADAEGDLDLRRTAVMSLILGHWITGDPATGEAVARREVAAGPVQDPDVTWLSFAAYAALLGLQTGRGRGPLVEEFGPLLAEHPVFRSRPFMEGAVVLALADVGDVPRTAAVAAGGPARAGTDPQWRAVALWAAVELAWSAGRDEEACALADEVLALGVGDYPAAVQARVVGAHAAVQLGRPPAGPPPTAVPPAWASATAEWAALRALADGDTVAAEAGFVAAATGWAGIDCRSELRCRWAAGDTAARAGRREGVEHLDAVAARAGALGIRAMEDRARRSLRLGGTDRRSVGASGLGGLTRRELEVLDLVAGGLTTSQIAAALGLGEATVNGFVASAARRLGVSGRVAAAARVRALRAEGVGPVNDP